MDGMSASVRPADYEGELVDARPMGELPSAVERLTNTVDRSRALLSQLEDVLGPVLIKSELGADRAGASELGGCRTAMGQAVWLQAELLGEANVRMQDIIDRLRLAL